MEPGEALHQGKVVLGCSKIYLQQCSGDLTYGHMVRGKHGFYKQSNRKRVKQMYLFLVWMNIRELVLLEQ